MRLDVFHVNSQCGSRGAGWSSCFVLLFVPLSCFHLNESEEEGRRLHGLSSFVVQI